LTLALIEAMARGEGHLFKGKFSPPTTSIRGGPIDPLRLDLSQTGQRCFRRIDLPAVLQDLHIVLSRRWRMPQRLSHLLDRANRLRATS